MKKLFIGLTVGLILVAMPVNAQTVEQLTQYRSLLVQLVALYEQLLAAMLAEAPSIDTTPIVVPPAIGAPVETALIITNVTPTVMKDIEIQRDNLRMNDNGYYYDVYAFYTENGLPVLDVPVTISADDDGVFNSEGVAYENTATQNTHTHVGMEGRIGVNFQYIPADSGNRVITATANGVSKSIIGWGQK